MSPAQQRSPEQIRRDIEQHRQELGAAMDRLRGEVQRATDWRSQILANQQKVMIGAAVAGFVIGGGVAAIGGIIFGRRRR